MWGGGVAAMLEALGVLQPAKAVHRSFDFSYTRDYDLRVLDTVVAMPVNIIS